MVILIYYSSFTISIHDGAHSYIKNIFSPPDFDLYGPLSLETRARLTLEHSLNNSPPLARGEVLSTSNDGCDARWWILSTLLGTICHRWVIGGKLGIYPTQLKMSNDPCLELNGTGPKQQYHKRSIGVLSDLLQWLTLPWWNRPLALWLIDILISVLVGIKLWNKLNK